MNDDQKEVIEALRAIVNDAVADAPAALGVFIIADVRSRNLFGRGILQPPPPPNLAQQATAALQQVTNAVGNDLSTATNDVKAAINQVTSWLYNDVKIAEQDVANAVNTITSWLKGL